MLVDVKPDVLHEVLCLCSIETDRESDSTMTDSLPRRERKKAQTRKVLLDAALRLMSDRGIHATRVEDITERSDVGKGAFYGHFASKNALVAALVREGVDLLCRDYLSGVLALADLPARVAAVVEGHETFFAERPVFVVIFHQARGLAKVGAADEEIGAVFADYLRRIAELLVPSSDRSRTILEERMGLAAVVLGAIAGYRSFQMAARLEVDARTLTDVLTTGVAGAVSRGSRARVRPVRRVAR